MRKMYDDNGSLFRYNENVNKNLLMNGKYRTVASKNP